MSHNNAYLNGPTVTNLNYYRHFYRKTLFFIIKDKKMFFVAGSELPAVKEPEKRDLREKVKGGILWLLETS